MYILTLLWDGEASHLEPILRNCDPLLPASSLIELDGSHLSPNRMDFEVTPYMYILVFSFFCGSPPLPSAAWHMILTEINKTVGHIICVGSKHFWRLTGSGTPVVTVILRRNQIQHNQYIFKTLQWEYWGYKGGKVKPRVQVEGCMNFACSFYNCSVDLFWLLFHLPLCLRRESFTVQS